MEAKIKLDKLSDADIVELVEHEAFSQDTMYWIALQYKGSNAVCRAILQKATWITLLNELSKNPDPEISAEAKRRKEACNHPA